MALELFFHPFSSYSQKALTAFYEKGIGFTARMLSPDAPDTYAEFVQRWPIKRFPVLVDGTRTLLEATTIIEYLEVNYPDATPLIPRDPQAAVEVRMLDRVFDNYVSTPQQKLVFDTLRAPDARDPQGVADARAMLDASYAWLDQHMAGREWAAADRFSLADCGAGPFLFYADWCHPIDPALAHLRAYRARLLARPSFARAVNEARPYRHLFPLGAPDRD